MCVQAISKAAERLEDLDDSVRLAAVKVMCELCTSHPDKLTGETLKQVMIRLRDTKVAIRRETATGLVQAFRVMAGRLATGKKRLT